METIKSTNVFVCAKNLSIAKDHGFEPYKKYNISGIFGDPEKAIELGYNNYLPMDCISAVTIVNKLGNQVILKIGANYVAFKDYPFLFDFFIEEKEYRKLKLTKLKKRS